MKKLLFVLALMLLVGCNDSKIMNGNDVKSSFQTSEEEKPTP